MQFPLNLLVNSETHFIGINNNKILSKSCIPPRAAIPIYKKTPYSTGIGMWLNNPVIITDNPINKNVTIPVTRCSLEQDKYTDLISQQMFRKRSGTSNFPNLTPMNWATSPGALDSDSTFNEFTWLIDKTVAATYIGSPKNPTITISADKTQRSRW